MSLADDIINGTYKQKGISANTSKKETQTAPVKNVSEEIISGTYTKRNINTNLTSKSRARLNTIKKKQEQNLNQIVPIKNVVNSFKNMSNAIQKGAKENIKNEIQDFASNPVDKTKYIFKAGGSGIFSGTTGIAQAPITDAASEANKGKEKDWVELADNSIRAIGSLINPMGYANNAIKAPIKINKQMLDTLKNKDKNPWEKVSDIVLNNISESKGTLPAQQMYSSTMQNIGKAMPNASEELLKLNEKVGEPAKKLREQIAKESENYDGITNFLAGGAQSIGNMVPSIVASAITKDPKVAGNVALATMGLSVKGQATQEALDKGMDIEKANQIGDAKALVEVGTEKMTGGAKLFGGGTTAEEALRKQIKDKVKNKVLKTIANAGLDIAGEGLEETVSDVVDTAIDKGTVDKNASYSWGDWGKTQGITALTTLALNGLGIGGNAITQRINNIATAPIQQTQNQPTAPINNQQNNIAQNENMEQIDRQRRLVELKSIDTSEMGFIERGKIKTEIRALEQGYNSIEEYQKAEKIKREQAIQEYEQRQAEKKNLEKQKSEQLKKDIKESTPMKNAQFEIIQKTNPMLDDYHTGIRSPKDIKTFNEVINDEESFTWGDFSKEDAQKALEDGKITIYSSYPIENGVFVSTSRVQAEDYAGGRGNKVYSKEVPLEEVAWINGDEGQYAKAKIAPVNNQIQADAPTNVQNLLNNEISTAIQNRTSKGKVSLGRVSNNVVNSVKSLLGIDVTNRTHVLADNDIRHMLNEHGDPKVEAKRGQIAITEDDIQKIPDIVDNYDDIVKGNPNRNGDTIRYIKNFEDGTTYLVEVVPETSKTLNIKTMWKKPTSLANQLEPSLTSKTQSRSISSTSNNSIPQNTDNVNNTTINNNYAQNTQNDTQNQPIPPINNTQGETINWNEIERPEGKIRKHYKSIIESSNTTAEAKKIARELMGSDTYVPESNKQHLNEADRRIQTNGADNELKVLTSLSNRIDAKITANDIAVGERLIEYYSKIGNKAKLQEAIQTTAMAGTQAGRTVQALSLLNHQTPQGQVTWIQRSVDKMNQELVKKRGQNAQQFNFTPEMQQKIMETNTQEEMHKALDEVYEELGQQVSKSRLEQIDSWRYFSMLANPKTHIRNIVGNVAMGKLQSAKNKIAGAIEGTVAQFNPNMERTHTLKPASKEVRSFAKNDISNVADRLELNDNKYNPKSRLENSMRTFKSDAIENTLGKAFELNEKALEVEDAWGLKSGYVKALSEYMTANNLNPQTITDAQLAKARNYAIAEAKEATFHSENAIATAINQFSRKNKVTKGITDAVLPFVKTPMNVAKGGMEYNPAGLIKTLTYDTVQLRKGNISVNKYIDNLSKGLTGTGVAILGYAMAKAGILKASGGDDEKKEKFDEAIGKQSYSLEINGKTYSLDWLAPAGIPLFVGAEAHNINKAGKNEKTSKSTDDDKQSKQIIESMENWANAMTNSMSPMAEMSMISGLTSALKSYDQDSQKMLGTIGTNAVKSYVNQFVPTALGQVARTADDYERSTTSTAKGILPKAIDQTKLQMMSKIPGLRQQLPIKTDVWGKEQKQEGNVVERGVKNAILPFNIKSVSNSKVDKALNELYGKTGAVSILPTTSLDKTFKIDGQTYRMTNEEYNKYRKSYGQNSYKLLDSLVSSNDYKNLNNEQKQKAIESVYSYAKEKNKVDYAKNNKIKIKPSTLYKTMEDIKSKGGNQSSYLHYISKTENMTKQNDKIKVLTEAKYSDKEKTSIYENCLKSKDKEDTISTYEIMKKAGLNINEWLKYSQQEFESDKEDDGTVSGKSVSGSKKQKVYSYINSASMNYNQRLLLLGTQYKLNNSERRTLVNYVNNMKADYSTRMKIFSKIKGVTVYKNGTIKY